jgi:hypothetical protein
MYNVLYAEKSAMLFKILKIYCPDGEIGRRAGLKIQFRKECRFKSDSGHHIEVHYSQDDNTSVTLRN